MPGRSSNSSSSCSSSINSNSGDNPSEAGMKTRDFSSMVKAFHQSYDKIVEISLESYYEEELPGLHSFLDRDKKMMQYTIKGGQCFRGVLVFAATLELIERRGEGAPSSERIQQIMSVGWALEILQAAFLVADDIMDESHTRRGKACWHKVDRVHAYNDVFKLEHFAFYILKRHLSQKDFVSIQDIFRGVILKTAFGQGLDLEYSSLIKQLAVEWPGEEAVRMRLSMPAYDNIVAHKTSFYTFHLPLAAALCLANGGGDEDSNVSANDDREGETSSRITIKKKEKVKSSDDFSACDDGKDRGVLEQRGGGASDEERYPSSSSSPSFSSRRSRGSASSSSSSSSTGEELAKKIGLELGQYFQVQDDFLDVYGDPKKTGKIGTDIEQRKLTWLMAKAVEKTTDEKDLRTLFQPSKRYVEKVREVFSRLSLRDCYLEYEASVCAKIKSWVRQGSSQLPTETILLILNKVHSSRVKKESATTVSSMTSASAATS